MNSNHEDAQKKINKALKRNLEKQINVTEIKVQIETLDPKAIAQ